MKVVNRAKDEKEDEKVVVVTKEVVVERLENPGEIKEGGVVT